MLSFFEMLNLVEGMEDFIARRKPGIDPNALKGQGTGQVRKDKNVSKRVGDNWSGYSVRGEPVLPSDAMLNRNTKAASQSPEDIAYRNMAYKRVQDPTGGIMSPDPDEDLDVLGPRQRNPALRGMGGVGERRPAPPPAMAPKVVDKSPPSLQMLKRLHNGLRNMIDMGGGNLTKARQMYLQMQDLLPQAQQEIDMRSQRNPEEAENWINTVVGIENFLKHIPGEFGLVRGESTAPALQWRYYSA